MISRRTMGGGLAIAACAIVLAGCGRDRGSDAGATGGEVRLSILSNESAQKMEPNWRPILADMEQAIGRPVKPTFSTNAAQLVEAMRAKASDLGWFSNRSGLDAVRRGGGEVFARTFEPSGTDGYASILIVPAKSKLTLDRVLRCDRTLTFGMGDALSTSGTLAPMTYLFAPKGVRPTTCFKKVRIGASHQTNLDAVATGQLDVATNTSTALFLNRQHGHHEADAVRVIWQSPTLPENPIIWRRDLDPVTKEKLRQFFLTYGEGESRRAAQERANMARINIGGFKPADDNHLLPVREMEATELWLLAKEGGDATKIAAAKKTLDAITAQRLSLEARTRAPAAAQ